MKKISNKIILLTIGISLFLFIVFVSIMDSSLIKGNRQNIELLTKNLYSDFDLNAKNQVQTAYSVIETFYKLEQKGELSRDEAMKQAANTIRNLKYGTDGYFWIDTKEGINVVLMGKEIEGKSRIDQQDSKGKYLIREIIENGSKPGGGFTDYWFPKPGSSEPMPKRSYSLAFEPYNWVIGTGNYIDDIEAIINNSKSAANQTLRSSITTIFIFLVVILIVIILISNYFGRRISSPIVHFVDNLRNVSLGELDVEIKSDSKDETGQLAVATNQMVSKLKEIVGNISKGSYEILSASEQMSQSSLQLSNGASEQAASTEEVSSSMEQMLANIHQNAINAKETETISNSASKGIERVTDRSNKSLEAIRKIADKINIINDIASQTNILALNAAVEAARAGEHGKGFAVVAIEVRKLAEMSAVAANEIVALSKHSLDVAEESTQILLQVLPDIEKTMQLVQEISASSAEQSIGVEQINNAIQQLNNVTQQNAAASEQLASSSEQLSAQAENLKMMIGFFRITGDSVSKNISSKAVKKEQILIEKTKTFVQPKSMAFKTMAKPETENAKEKRPEPKTGLKSYTTKPVVKPIVKKTTTASLDKPVTGKMEDKEKPKEKKQIKPVEPGKGVHINMFQEKGSDSEFEKF
jgi:methyl-accepting chemotaxis protein